MHIKPYTCVSKCVSEKMLLLSQSTLLKGYDANERQKKKNRIYLSVFNTTEYISKEQIAHLFDRFYRTDASRNSQTGGYGLGLSIAAATVESHRGKMIAETKDEKSLRITVIF